MFGRRGMLVLGVFWSLCGLSALSPRNADAQLTRAPYYGQALWERDERGRGYWDYSNTGRTYGTVGLPFLETPSAGCPNSTWFFPTAVRVATGRLAPGLQLQANGTVSGVPTMAGSYSMTIAYDSLVCAGMQYGPGTIALTIITTGN